MPLVKINNDISNTETFEDGKRFISDTLGQVVQAINGLDFDLNIRSSIVDVVFTAANTNVRIYHKLNRNPVGYILMRSNAAVNLYDGDAPMFGTDYINLKSSAIANVKILII